MNLYIPKKEDKGSKPKPTETNIEKGGKGGEKHRMVPEERMGTAKMEEGSTRMRGGRAEDKVLSPVNM